MSILFFQSLMNGLMLAGLYSLISAGVTLIFGVLHIVNFAQGAFLMLGAYLFYYVITLFGFDFYTSLVLAVLIVGGLAILTERYLYHRFWLHGAVLPCLVVSVGLTQIMQNGALLVFGIHPRVSQLWVGECDQLTGVTRIRDHLLISGHSRVEHDLSDNGAPMTERAAPEDSAICQDEKSFRGR